jgi:hypothetical protein
MQTAIQAAHPFLASLHDTWLGGLMRDITWMFWVFQAIHFAGMSLLVGVIGIIDLRVLGFAKGLPLGPLHRFIPLAIFGFALNLLTGIGFLTSDPYAYYFSTPFRIKMVLVLLGGLNALWFWISISPKIHSVGSGMDASPTAKLISLLSLLFWIAVITAGRFIAFGGNATL